MIQQKPITIGNSTGMTFSADLVKKFKINKKSPFFLEKTDYGLKIIFDKSKHTDASAEDVSWLRNFIQKHKKGYLELAKRWASIFFL